jgi:hypothetical protein
MITPTLALPRLRLHLGPGVEMLGASGGHFSPLGGSDLRDPSMPLLPLSARTLVMQPRLQ